MNIDLIDLIDLIEYMLISSFRAFVFSFKYLYHKLLTTKNLKIRLDMTEVPYLCYDFTIKIQRLK